MKTILTLAALAALSLAAYLAAVPAEAHVLGHALAPLADPAALAGLSGLALTTLAADKARTYELGDISEIGVVAADIVYEGAAVGENGSGYGRPLNAGDPFLGFAEQQADNSAGAAGDVRVRMQARGRIQLAISGLAITDIGKPVYASDDDTFTLTASTNSFVGRVVRFVSTGVGIVEFDATRAGRGNVTPLTDNSGGTASDTIADVPGTYTEATLANQIASIVAKVNALIAMQK